MHGGALDPGSPGLVKNEAASPAVEVRARLLQSETGRHLGPQGPEQRLGVGPRASLRKAEGCRPQVCGCRYWEANSPGAEPGMLLSPTHPQGALASSPKHLRREQAFTKEEARGVEDLMCGQASSSAGPSYHECDNTTVTKVTGQWTLDSCPSLQAGTPHICSSCCLLGETTVCPRGVLRRDTGHRLCNGAELELGTCLAARDQPQQNPGQHAWALRAAAVPWRPSWRSRELRGANNRASKHTHP